MLELQLGFALPNKATLRIWNGKKLSSECGAQTVEWWILTADLPIPHNQQCQIVSLSRAPRKLLHFIQNRFHHQLNRVVRTSLRNLVQPLKAEKFLLRVCGFHNAV